MASLRKRDKTLLAKGSQAFMQAALAGFEHESYQACRALRVRTAMTVFGVGSLLPNDLPSRRPVIVAPLEPTSDTVH